MWRVPGEYSNPPARIWKHTTGFQWSRKEKRNTLCYSTLIWNPKTHRRVWKSHIHFKNRIAKEKLKMSWKTLYSTCLSACICALFSATGKPWFNCLRSTNCFLFTSPWLDSPLLVWGVARLSGSGHFSSNRWFENGWGGSAEMLTRFLPQASLHFLPVGTDGLYAAEARLACCERLLPGKAASHSFGSGGPHKFTCPVLWSDSAPLLLHSPWINIWGFQTVLPLMTSFVSVNF